MLVFTVDVEDWYQTSDFHIPVFEWHRFEQRVKKNTMYLLDLFDEFGAKGTFFVLGSVAQDYPELVREIATRGHEIGSHGFWHQMLHTMTFDDIRREVVDSKRLLEEITGTPVTCFRAPSWSMGPNRYEVFDILVEAGYTCDSSIQPFHTPLSGVNIKMRAPFYPIIEGRKLEILEIPSSTLQIGSWNLPFAGGLYLRTFPMRFVHWGLKQLMKEQPAMVYVHPWEIDQDQPKITRSPLIRFVHYYNLSGTEAKIRKLLRAYPTSTMREMAAVGNFSTYAL